jgi:hypothetical protein
MFSERFEGSLFLGVDFNLEVIAFTSYGIFLGQYNECEFLGVVVTLVEVDFSTCQEETGHLALTNSASFLELLDLATSHVTAIESEVVVAINHTFRFSKLAHHDEASTRA